jgi:lipoprotein-anchoring transpeptidase ErfK/SrfK
MKFHNYPQSLKTVLIGLFLTLTCFSVVIIPQKVLANRINVFDQEMIELKQTQRRWIEINLTTQRLIAWEGNKSVYAVIVSTGRANTPTIPGVFNIQQKREIDRMVGETYDVPNVPYAMYYHGGYAIHGAYWHNNFGTPMSHGCTNVAVDHARWLFSWANIGTPVVIHY